MMNCNQHQVLIIGTGNEHSIIDEIFDKARNKQIEGVQYTAPYIFPNKAIEKIYHLFYFRWGKFFRRFSNRIWNSFSVLNKIELREDETLHIIFLIGRDVNRLYCPILIERLKEKYHNRVQTILLLFDSINLTKEVNEWDRIVECFDTYDKVATFDLEDAKKYDLMHFWDPYEYREVETSEEYSSDLFFIGVDRGRSTLLSKIADAASKQGIKVDFMIYGMKEDVRVGHGVKAINNFMPYDEVIKYVKGAKCLVEIVADGQSSSSLRYYEAVVYNKRLISNNPNISIMPCYNPAYMQIISSVNDIDFGSVKSDQPVDYRYSGEFSLENLIKSLCNDN